MTTKFSRRNLIVNAAALAIPLWIRDALGHARPSLAESDQDVLLHPSSRVWKRKAPRDFQVRFETSQGAFFIEVHRDWAPLGADRFANLVRNGFYDDQRFTRVVAGYIAQFGIHGNPEVAGAWKNQTIPDDPVRQSNRRGFIAFAMTGPDTRSTQVYINLVDNTRLDAQGFAPFGRVVEGMEVVDRLYSGYGENSGGGMRGGKQGPIEVGGNSYLQREYPKLDYIIRARLTAADGKTGRAQRHSLLP